ncbi:MAG TPA: glycerol-3-phosphate dehydrogenase C-terminal domain-containing protein, partial [Thermodesulfobacteriota bacterium]
ERAVDLAVRRLGRRARPASTAATPLPGAGAAPEASSAFEARVAARYGALWPEVAAHAAARPELGRPLADGTPVTGAEVVHAVREEMAVTLTDVALRRTGLAASGWPGDAVVAAAGRLAAREAGWDATRTAREVDALRRVLAGWREPRRPAWSSAPRR